jgi:ZIP family zinc transporter
MKEKLKKVWLLVFALIIHNLPEGLAVGTSLVYNLEVGLVTAIAIGIQDFPEGTVVSLPLAAIQRKSLGPVLIGVLSGLAEMVMVILGAVFFTAFSGILPYGLGLAGGAMLYVTVKEMIPEIYRGEKSETLVTLGFFAGFYVMLLLDSALG